MTDKPKAGEGNNQTPQDPEANLSEEVKAIIEKRVQQRLSQAGRDDKTLTDRKALLDTQEAEIKRQREQADTWRRQREEAELEAVKDNPDATELVKARQKLAAREEVLQRQDEDLKRREAKANEYEQAYQKSQKDTLAQTIASKHPGVTAEELLTYTNGTEEQMTALATRLSGKPNTLHPDNNLTHGGGSADLKSLRKQFIADPTNRELYHSVRAAEAEEERKKRF